MDGGYEVQRVEGGIEMSKPRRRLEPGDKIEYIRYDGMRAQAFVLSVREEAVELVFLRKDKDADLTIHRRQVTKVWVKKPKPKSVRVTREQLVKALKSSFGVSTELGNAFGDFCKALGLDEEGLK